MIHLINQWFTQSTDSPNQSMIHPSNQWFTQSINDSPNQSMIHSIIDSPNQSMIHPINKSFSQSINDSPNQSMVRQINQWFSQSINDYLNQSFMQSRRKLFVGCVCWEWISATGLRSQCWTNRPRELFPLTPSQSSLYTSSSNSSRYILSEFLFF